MRRKIILSAALTAIAAFAFAPVPALAHGDRVSVNDSYTPGTIVIRTGERRLYYFVGSGEAIRYPVGVGRAGMQWSGTASINGKYIEPAWSAPASIRRDYRSLPSVVPGGSSHNPMGAAAMTLSGGEYAIHGTNASAAQIFVGIEATGLAPCFRSKSFKRRARSVDSCRMAASALYNEDIMDLYGHVGVGTRVVVTR
jgi:lipoprotein-anchoring transpeptidase ErfK/SrfK